MKVGRYAANETAKMYADKPHELEDKALFIKNLGWLLSQTREGIEKCTMSDNGESAFIHFKDDYIVEVNINMDSYMAIIRDVAEAIR